MTAGIRGKGRAVSWVVVAAFGLLATYVTGVFPKRANPNDLSPLGALAAKD